MGLAQTLQFEFRAVVTKQNKLPCPCTLLQQHLQVGRVLIQTTNSFPHQCPLQNLLLFQTGLDGRHHCSLVIVKAKQN
jgi:hypothetical protein